MSEQFNRRDFLRGLGVAVGGVVVIGPQLAGCVHFDDSVSTVGVYVPGGQATATEQFVAGMSTARDRRQEAGATTRLVVQGFEGAAPTPAGLRAFIERYDLDVVVALMNSAAAWPLTEVLRQTKTPLVIATAGLELADDQVMASPWVFTASLGGWEASYAAGVQSARRFGKRGVIATTTQEAGYDAVFAFHEGFAQTAAAAPVIDVVDAPVLGRSLDEAVAAIASHRPQVVYVLMSGEASEDFARVWRDQRGLAGVSLVGSTFSESSSERFVGWSPSIDVAQNREFRAAFETFGRRRADAFSALGWDAMGWLAHALDKPRQSSLSADVLAQALAAAEFEGVRGRYQVDVDTGRLLAPVFREQVDGELAERIDLPRDIHAALQAKLERPRSGCTSTYLG